MTITVQTAAFLVTGFAAGLIFFAALRRTASLFVEGGAPWRIAALYGLRLTIALSVFFAAAQFGAAALLSAIAGFTAARFFAERRERGRHV